MASVSPRPRAAAKTGAKLVTAAALSLCLAACDFVAADTDSLLHAPNLNAEQQAINAALEAVQDVSEIEYHYPASGDNRSPILLRDLDGDGEDEAIIFYSFAGDPASTRAKVLRRDGQGGFTAAYDIPFSTEQIDFVRFANLLSSDAFCMIVGWIGSSGQMSREESKYLDIYSFSGGSYTPEISRHPYADYLVQDFDGDGLEDVVTVGWASEEERFQTFSLSLLRSVGQRIAVTDRQLLSREAESLEQVISGTLWDGSSAVYIDQKRRDSFTSMATEIIRIGSDGMTLLVGGDSPDSDQARLVSETLPVDGEGEEDEHPAWENYTTTFRDGDRLSRDYNGDGVVEVPNPVMLPGNLYAGDDNPLMLTQLMQLTDDGFIIYQQAVINDEEGYLFIMPDEWLGWVSVARDDEGGEWRFYLIDVEDEATTIELLRIQSTGMEATVTGMIELGARGTRRFYGYIPLTTEDTPSITEERLKELFHILT